MVTHDPEAAGHAARRLYVDKGRLVDQSSPTGV
jgi:ABC-type lipoprotein export system ATPase subunit